MTSNCRTDPVVCIDFVVLFIAEFLKDWTTLGMMAVLLGLLFKVRAKQLKERESAYARQMEAYLDRKQSAENANLDNVEGGGTWSGR